MSQRSKHAIGAQLGACNPIALIRALNEGLDELKQEQPSWDTPTILTDPALRLIVHQLAHLYALCPDIPSAEYLAACRAVGMPE
jgi:hypothetical protein